MRSSAAVLKVADWMLWLGVVHGRDAQRRWVLVGLRSVDLPTAFPGKGSSTFPHQPYAEGKGVARVRAFAESVLKMINRALSGRRERVVARQRLHDP
jgi:hypothetical protein